MAQKSERREKGTGTIYEREPGKWMGKIIIGTTAEGKPKAKYFSGKTEAEVKRKIREYNKAGSKEVATKVTLGTYLLEWLKTYKLNSIKRSSYDALEGTAKNHIIPNLGMIQLGALTGDDIQKLLNKMKADGYSHSTVKKAHDCLNAVLKHALIKEDIVKNPMLQVIMPAASLFPQKEIRFYTAEEALRITEEATREYSTGRLVYIYGYVFILMLHTGLRLGEAIGLEKTDWDTVNNTLKIQRNIQSVKKRDKDGNAVTGRELISNTTKTYSGERTLALNATATNALTKLCEAHPGSKYIVCDGNGNQVPPERVERTFYYLLKNVGLEKDGVHSLRHTFASLLFAQGTEIKVVSKLLGHASVQITMNIYVHLYENVERDAVAQLDGFIEKKAAS